MRLHYSTVQVGTVEPGTSGLTQVQQLQHRGNLQSTNPAQKGGLVHPELSLTTAML